MLPEYCTGADGAWHWLYDELSVIWLGVSPGSSVK